MTLSRTGYQPHAVAQSLRSGTSNMIGLLIPDMHNPHYWEIAYGVDQEVQRSGYEMMLLNAALNPARELQIVKALARRRIDGLILLVTFITDVQSEIEMLVRENMPIVIVGNSIQDIDSVRNSFSEGALSLMQHLTGLGHRRIGMIFGVGQTPLGQERLDAYRCGLQNAGLPVDEDLIQHCGTTIEGGYEATSRLLNRDDRPTAIVSINDYLAMGAQHAAFDHHLRVPDDLSIVGFDDIDIASYVTPPLTTVHSGAEEMGRAAAQLVLRRLKTPQVASQQVMVASQLVIRGSSGPAPAHVAEHSSRRDAR